MSTELHTKYRPTEFKQVVGHEHLVTQIEAVIAKRASRVLLFVGPTGTGKTTLARIVAQKVGADGPDSLREMDAATNNSIDDMRHLMDIIQYRPMSKSPTRVVILDECFVAGTPVTTRSGRRSIESVKVGDLVLSHKGWKRVIGTFKNRVSLDRLTRVQTSDHKVIFCSCDHKFYTANRGWVEARHLRSLDQLCKVVSNEMSNMQEAGSQKEYQNVFDALPSGVGVEAETEVWSNTDREDLFSNLQGLFESIPDEQSNQNVLFSEVRKQDRFVEASRPETRAMEEGNSSGYSTFHGSEERSMGSSGAGTIQKNESQKSNAAETNNQPHGRYKASKWNAQSGSAAARGEREDNRAAENLIGRFELAGRGLYQDQKESLARIPSFLQGRYRKLGDQIGGGGGWKDTQHQSSEETRYQEADTTGIVGVESVEIFKPGSNDRSFESVVNHQDRRRGFAHLYDLEVEDAHSYFVNDLLVHNCHNLSKSAWTSLLKTVEEPPNDVWIIFCTTDSAKVPENIKNRCVVFSLKPVSTDDIYKMLFKINKKEEVTSSEDVLYLAAERAAGSPRKAITMLEALHGVEDRKSAAKILDTSDVETSDGPEADLCRQLVKGEMNWSIMQKHLLALKDTNPEGVRQVVLAWMTKVLINARSQDQAESLCKVIDVFSVPYTTSNGIWPVALSLSRLVF